MRRRRPQATRKRATGNHCAHPADDAIRAHFRSHPELLGRLLHLCTGLAPPATLTAEARGDEVLLRAQGGETPFYLLSILPRPDARKLHDWPLLWLDVTKEAREEGWLVVLTDRQEVMDWLEGPAFQPRHGVGILPLALDLSRQIAVLLQPRDPLLSAVALWAARGAPGSVCEPIWLALRAQLDVRNDPVLAAALAPLLAATGAMTDPGHRARRLNSSMDQADLR